MTCGGWASTVWWGDSTDPGVVERVLAGVRPHLMVTDPPYGVEYDPAWRNRAGLGATQRVGKVENDDRADWREAWVLFPGEVAYVWRSTTRPCTSTSPRSWRAARWRRRPRWRSL